MHFEQADYQSLLSRFFTECESCFRFLEINHGFHYLSGLVTYQAQRQYIKPYKTNQTLARPFTAVTRYEKSDLTLEILYSEDFMQLECYLIKDQTFRVQLDDILLAIKRAQAKIGFGQASLQADNLSSSILKLSEIIKENKNKILSLNDKIFERALTIREKLMEHSIRERLKNELAFIQEEAARAFTGKEYEKVIMLYRPYESYLSPSDRKKLEQARRMLLRL